VEMLIQLHLNPTVTQAAKAYRLQVKERLYHFSYASAAARHSEVVLGVWG